MIDIGCGVGNMLKACLDFGAQTIRGVDGSWVNKDMLLIPQESFSQHDLSQQNLREKIPEKSFDLTISSEVAEHIDPKDCEIYMDNLTSFSDVILFSAAIPNQGGTHHVNEQWPSYWIEKFSHRGFIPVDCIRAKIWDDESIYVWYRQNIMFFVRKECLKNYPNLESEADNPVIDIVHPDLWNARKPKRFRELSFRANCKNIIAGFVYIIPSFIKAVTRRITRE